MLGWGKTASKQKQGHLSNWVYEKLSQKHSCLYALAVYGPPVTQESGSEKATGGQKVGKSSLFIPVGKLVFEIWPVLTVTEEWASSLWRLGTNSHSALV